MLSWFKQARHANARAGVVLAERALALAVVMREPNGKPAITHCATHPLEDERGQALKAAFDKAAAQRLPTCAVVDGDDYQLVQVEAPDVLPSEMRAAIRWRLKDAIAFSADEAAIDIFEIPEPARQTQSKMLFAAAARDSAIQRIAGALKPVAKRFDAIDIPDLCLRNVSACLPQDAKGMAMLALHENFAQLVITRQASIYVTRRIDLHRGFNPHSPRASQNGIDAGALALELQRSLDYYESHYDQTPIGDLVLAPADERAHALAASLREETSLRISVLDVREHFSVYRGGEVITDWATLMAFGAALRVDMADA